MENLRISKSLPAKKPAKNRYLHSPAHLLADELSAKLRDKRHFGLYLKMATVHDHNFLRKLASEVLEAKDVQSPGKLFSYLVKKNSQPTT